MQALDLASANRPGGQTVHELAFVSDVEPLGQLRQVVASSREKDPASHRVQVLA